MTVEELKDTIQRGDIRHIDNYAEREYVVIGSEVLPPENNGLLWKIFEIQFVDDCSTIMCYEVSHNPIVIRQVNNE